MPRIRLIRTKLSAALALSALLQRFNNQVVQLDLEQDLDGITQLSGDLILVSFQLQTDPTKLETMGALTTRLERMMTEVHMDHGGLAMWERMHRSAKLDELRSQVRQAKALILAYNDLPVVLERRFTKLRSAHPPEVGTGQVVQGL